MAVRSGALKSGVSPFFQDLDL